MVAMKDIRAFVRRIADEFHPRRIILFGSYAFGTPNDDSDVDLMVVFGGRGSAVDRALEIRLKLPFPGFPMDLLSRSEGEMRRRIRMNDWFFQETVEKGMVLYDSEAVKDRTIGSKPRVGAARVVHTYATHGESHLLPRGKKKSRHQG